MYELPGWAHTASLHLCDLAMSFILCWQLECLVPVVGKERLRGRGALNDSHF